MENSKKRRTAPKRDLAENVILDYLRELFETTKGNHLTLHADDKKNCFNETNLIKHTFRLLNEKYGYVDSDSANDSVDGVTSKPTINRNTIIDAIHKLEEEEKIVYDEIREYYKYLPTSDDLKDLHPILDIAPQIQIRSLPTNNLAFFEVKAAYATAICEYINACFSNGEIRAYPLGDLILCIGVENSAELAFIPAGTSYNKNTISYKVSEILKNFSIK